MAAEPTLDIYFDANCAFCRWSRARVEPWDTRHRLRFLDCNDPGVAASTPYSHDELAREMYVHGPGARWSTGFLAWTNILRALPCLVWLGWLLSMPPFRWLGPPVYAWVARHRGFFPGVPPPCTGETCPPPDRRHP